MSFSDNCNLVLKHYAYIDGKINGQSSHVNSLPGIVLLSYDL
jgi:hypothetical protein